MIGTIEIKCSASHPQMGLPPLFTVQGSPSSVRLMDVPKSIGEWQITKVSFLVKYPDNSTIVKEAKRVGNVWVATVDGTEVAGKVSNGYEVLADGTSEDGIEVVGYVLGRGDVNVLERDSKVTRMLEKAYVKYMDSLPTQPSKGDIVYHNSTLQMFNGEEWLKFSDKEAIERIDAEIEAVNEDISDIKQDATALEGKVEVLESDVKEIADEIPTKTSQLENDSGFPTYENPGHFIKYDSYDERQAKWYINFGKESMAGITLYSDSEDPAQSYIEVAGNLIRSSYYTPPSPPPPELPDDEDNFTARLEDGKWYNQDGKEIEWDENAGAWYFVNDEDGNEPMGVGRPPETWMSSRMARRDGGEQRLTFNDAVIPVIDDLPTKTSELENDSGYITQEAVPTKTSQLTNNSGFVTTSQMNTAISKKSVVQGILWVSGDEYVIQGTGGGYDHKNMTISEIVNAYLTTGFVLYSGGNANNDRLWDVANYSTTATTKWITFQNITRDSTTGEFMVWYATYTGNGTWFTQTTNSTRIVSKTNLPKVMRDNGFITQEAIPTNISYFQNDQGYIDAGGKSEIQSDYEGKINDLKNNLEIQIGQKADTTDVPTSTSQLTNDSGFITIEDVPQGSEAIYECVNDDQSVNVKLVKDVYGKWSVENDVGIDNTLNALMVVKTNDGVKMYQPTDMVYDPERTEHMDTWWELGDWEHSGESVTTTRDELLNYQWMDTAGHQFQSTDIKWYVDEESYMGSNTYQIFILKVMNDNGQTKVGEFERMNTNIIPTKTSDLVNDDGFVTAGDVDDKIENIPTTTISGEYEDGTSFQLNVLIKE